MYTFNIKRLRHCLMIDSWLFSIHRAYDYDSLQVL